MLSEIMNFPRLLAIFLSVTGDPEEESTADLPPVAWQTEGLARNSRSASQCCPGASGRHNLLGNVLSLVLLSASSLKLLLIHIKLLSII
jgi:hypothetical protein